MAQGVLFATGAAASLFHWAPNSEFLREHALLSSIFRRPLLESSLSFRISSVLPQLPNEHSLITSLKRGLEGPAFSHFH